MRSTIVTIALTITPALLCAQVHATASSQTQANARVETHNANASGSATAQSSSDADFTAPGSFSADGRAKLEAAFHRARAQRVPTQQMKNRVAEGQARGAAEAQIVASAAQAEARLEASQRALVHAGRSQPSDSEVERGAQAEEQGVTSAQIEALAKHTPRDRSLVVALDALTNLVASGVPATQALAQVQANGGAQAGAHAGNGALSTTGNAAAGVNAAAKGAGSAAGVTGSLTGAVSGVVGRKP